MLRLVYVQYLLETLAFVAILRVSVFRRTRDPWKVLQVVVAANILRFGGAAAAFAALRSSSSPAFMIQVAVGDCATAALATIAVVLLRRRSNSAFVATTIMNLVGLADILVSETWIGYLDLTGAVRRSSALHGPSVGAALYTALHLYIFSFVAKRAR